jgi:hypothetical protein
LDNAASAGAFQPSIGQGIAQELRPAAPPGYQWNGTRRRFVAPISATQRKDQIMAKNNGNMHSGQQRQQNEERRNPGQQGGGTGGAGARQQKQEDSNRSANKSGSDMSRSNKGSGQQR